MRDFAVGDRVKFTDLEGYSDKMRKLIMKDIKIDAFSPKHPDKLYVSFSSLSSVGRPQAYIMKKDVVIIDEFNIDW